MRQRDWLDKSCVTRNLSLNIESLCGAKKASQTGNSACTICASGANTPPAPYQWLALCSVAWAQPASTFQCTQHKRPRAEASLPSTSRPCSVCIESGGDMCAERGSTRWHETPEIKMKRSGFSRSTTVEVVSRGKHTGGAGGTGVPPEHPAADQALL